MSAETQSTTSVATLEQRRAQHAWTFVRELVASKDKTESAVDDLAREAKKLPMRIRAAGLGQALAFLEAKDGNKGGFRKKLVAQISKWILRERRLGCAGRGPDSSLKDHVIHGDAVLLRRQTAETLAYLEWLNRLLEGEGLPRKDRGTKD